MSQWRSVTASSKNPTSSEDRIAGAHQDNPMIARKIPSLPSTGNLLKLMLLMEPFGNGHC